MNRTMTDFSIDLDVDGLLALIYDFIRAFHVNEKIVQSQKELIDFIVEKKPYMAESFQ